MPEVINEIKKIIAPSGVSVQANYLRVGDKFVKSFFVLSYPRYLSSGWFEPLINLPYLFDISIFINPIDTGMALKKLRKKAAQLEAQIAEQEEKGMVRDPMLETALRDVETLRDTLQQATEKLFNVGVYITIYADTLEELEKIENQITSIMDAKLIYIKPAIFQQLDAMLTTMPLGYDQIDAVNPMNSGPISSFFPFVSETLTSEEGIMYGINRHNNTLVIFDRFSLENANQVLFAKSGAGKSYTTKLEIIRYLMNGVDILVIDPENEYERLAKTFGGSFFNISLSSKERINPFDIPIVPEGEDPSDVLRSHIANLTGLLRLMLGGELSPEEDALIDQAITETYASREIVPGQDFSDAEPPLLEDLETVLENLKGGHGLAQRLYKYTRGSFSGFLNQPTNIDINNRLIVFSIRDLEEELRPIAMYIVLNFIWNLVRAKLKKRLLFIDEAWWMMKYEASATFLFGLVKRARKYYLGVSTITQDVEDFLRSPYGRPIITNSSIQILLKQAAATIEVVGKAFNLTEAEKNFLLGAEVGTGLFAAGKNRIMIQVIASFFEDKIITTDPEQLLAEMNISN